MKIKYLIHHYSKYNKIWFVLFFLAILLCGLPIHQTDTTQTGPEMEINDISLVQNSNTHLPKTTQSSIINPDQIKVSEERVLPISSANHPIVKMVNEAGSSFYQAMETSDVNNDGITDIIGIFNDNIIAIDGSDASTIYINQIMDASTGIGENIKTINKTLDGIEDFVVSSTHGEVYFVNGANGNLIGTNSDISSNGLWIEVFDYNNDDNEDVAIGTEEGDVYFIDGQTGSLLHEAYFNEEETEVNFEAMTSGFYDFDTILDIVTGYQNGTSVIISGSDGSLIDKFTNAIDPVIKAIELTDLDQDGQGDLVIGTSDTIYFVNGSTDVKEWDTTLSESGGVGHLTVANITNDYVLDVIIGSDFGITIIDGSDGSILTSNYSFETWADTVDFGDVNNDTKGEIIAGFRDSTVYVLNSSDLSIISMISDPKGSIIEVELVDFNDDGVTDIGVVSFDSNAYIFLSDFISPVVESIILPKVISENIKIDFQIIVGEPNLDYIFMGYKNTDGDDVIFPVDIFGLDNYRYEARFEGFEVTSNPFEYWIEVRDYYGNIQQIGNSTNPLTLDAALDNTFNHEVFSNPQIEFVDTIDHDRNGIDDLVLGFASQLEIISGHNNSIIGGKLGIGIGKIFDLQILNVTDDNIPDYAMLNGNQTHYTITVLNGSDFEELYSTPAFELTIGGAEINSGTFNDDLFTDLILTNDNGIFVYSGVDGSQIGTKTDLNPSDRYDTVHSYDYTKDNIDEIIVGEFDGQSSTLFILDGTDLSTIYQQPNLSHIDNLKLQDLNNDNIPEIIFNNQNEFIFVHQTLNSFDSRDLTLSSPSDIPFENFGFGEFNNDNIADIVVTTFEGQLFIFDTNNGTEILRSELLAENANSVPKFSIGEFTGDGNDDIFLVRDDGQYYIVDGTRGYTNDGGQLGSSLTSRSIKTIDNDKNGIDEVLMGTASGFAYAIQSLRPFQSIYPTINSPSQIEQGETSVTIEINLSTYYGYSIEDASVTLYGMYSKDKSINQALFATEIGDGVYEVTFSTENWLIGEWQIFIFASKVNFEDLRLVHYEAYLKDDAIYLNTVDIVGNVVNDISLNSNKALWDDKVNTMSGVTEGNNIFIEVLVQDTFTHLMDDSDVSVNVEFAGTENILDYSSINNKFEGNISTAGLEFKTLDNPYLMNITISGDFIEQDLVTSLSIEIVPQPPSFENDTNSLLIIGISSFAIFSFLVIVLNRVYNGLGKDPETVNLMLNRAMLFFGILFLVGTVVSILIYPSSAFQAFLYLVGTLGTAILFMFMLHFKITLNQYYKLNFKAIALTPSIMLTLIIGGLLSITLIITGWQSVIGEIDQWIAYNMAIQGQAEFMGIELPIPSIIWNVGIVSFFSGFLYIVLLDLFDTYSDIKDLKVIEDEVNNGYYPKSPNKLYEDITEEARDTFISLSKGFILWYAIIIVTLFNQLRLQSITSLLYFVFGPLILATLLFSRNFLNSWINLPISSLTGTENQGESTEIVKEGGIEESQDVTDLNMDIPDTSDVSDERNPDQQENGETM